MTTITIDRATVEQALEALQSNKANWPEKTNAITALRAALAEPVQDHFPDATKMVHEPVAQVIQDAVVYGVGISHGGKRIDPDSIYKKAEPMQEPVAKVELMMTGGNAGIATRIVEIDNHFRERLRPGQMLYTTPQPAPDAALLALARRTLWIAYAWNDHNFDHPQDIAREEAKAHGITSFEQANEWLTARRPEPDIETHAMSETIRLQDKEIDVLRKAARFAQDALALVVRADGGTTSYSNRSDEAAKCAFALNALRAALGEE